MGYRHQIKKINVKFETPHEYAGFEATLRGKTLGEYLPLVGIGEVDNSDIATQLREMSESLITWNLEDEAGAPVPATSEAVFAQDQELMLALCTSWMDGLAGIPAPLEQPSTGGELSLEASLPMAPLSQSQAS